GRRFSEYGTVAIALNKMTKHVFSETLDRLTSKNSRLLREPHEIKSMKERSGKGLIVFGSGSVVSPLTEHGSIDEYQLGRVPNAPRKRPAIAHRRPEARAIEFARVQGAPIR